MAKLYIRQEGKSILNFYTFILNFDAVDSITKNTIFRKGQNMLLENLRKLKKESGMTYEEIAVASKTPESTVKNIFLGKCEPLASTLYRIVNAFGASLDDVLADTNIVLSPKTLAEVQETAEVVEAERDLVLAELEMLRSKTAAQETEILLLKEKLQHKDELLAVYNYFTKIKPTE